VEFYANGGRPNPGLFNVIRPITMSAASTRK